MASPMNSEVPTFEIWCHSIPSCNFTPRTQTFSASSKHRCFNLAWVIFCLEFSYLKYASFYSILQSFFQYLFSEKPIVPLPVHTANAAPLLIPFINFYLLTQSLIFKTTKMVNFLNISWFYTFINWLYYLHCQWLSYSRIKRSQLIYEILSVLCNFLPYMYSWYFEGNLVELREQQKTIDEQKNITFASVLLPDNSGRVAYYLIGKT